MHRSLLIKGTLITYQYCGSLETEEEEKNWFRWRAAWMALSFFCHLFVKLFINIRSDILCVCLCAHLLLCFSSGHIFSVRIHLIEIHSGIYGIYYLISLFLSCFNRCRSYVHMAFPILLSILEGELFGRIACKKLEFLFMPFSMPYIGHYMMHWFPAHEYCASV